VPECGVRQIDQATRRLRGDIVRRLFTRRGSLVLAVVAVVAAFAWTAVAGAAPSADWTYVSNPPKAQVALSGSGVAAGGVPYCSSSSLGSLVCYAPSFIRSAYNVPDTLDGSGQTILIVDAYGSPTIASDLQHFDQTFGLPDPNFSVICPAGCPRASAYNFKLDPGGWAVETTLDVEWAHVIAPGANIVLVVAPSPAGNAINTAERKAIAQYPGAVMSQSFGIPEYAINAGSNNAQLKQAHKNYVAAQANGITVLASAGDDGATNGLLSGTNALFPSSDPLVTAVGGTQGVPYVPFGTQPSSSSGLVTFDGTCTVGTRPAWPSSCTPTGYGGEAAWNEPLFPVATGGAPSLLFPAPDYQQGVTGYTQRTTSDVSFDAAINGGVLVYISAYGQGPWYVVGGTSAGSPQWAGVVALANQARAEAGNGPLGFANPTLYAIGTGQTGNYSSDFHDITAGNNKDGGVASGYDAGTGYDLPTGWGTPNVANLVSDLAG